MVAKPLAETLPLALKLSSSKNPYGSKTASAGTVMGELLSSSKNPYGSKTNEPIANYKGELSSSKNPYGSKTE